jgi:aryl-alcohol dehydrogenase-like predicted oxidoreductase
MERRILGTAGLDVSAIGLGTMVLVDHMYGRANDEDSVATIRHAIDQGATFIDTADAYGFGANERLVGAAIAGRREEVQLATKWGIVAEPGPHAHPVQHRHHQQIMMDARPERAESALDQSLRRLGVDHVDLWYLHFVDPAVPIADSVGAMAELVTKGKVRHIGVSNVDREQLIAANLTHPITAVQVEYSLWTRDAEDDLLPLVRALGIGLVAWSPLGAGFLTGTVRNVRTDGEDFRSNHPRFTADNLQTNLDRYAPLTALAHDLDVTPAQLALGWLLAQSPNIVPIPSTRSTAHLDENLAAAQLRLDERILSRIDQVAPRGLAAGAALLEPTGSS